MALNSLKKLAGWRGDGVPWPDEIRPELGKARAELAAAKEQFTKLGTELANAHRRVLAIKDAPYIDLSAADGAERMAERRREYSEANRRVAELQQQRQTLRARIAELEPQVQQLSVEASGAILENIRPHHAALVRRVFLGWLTPIADSIAAQVELASLIDELKRREVRYGALPAQPTPGLPERYAQYREQASELIAVGVLSASDLPPALAKAWRMA